VKKGFEFLGRWFYRAFVARIAKLAAMILLVSFAPPSSYGQTLHATIQSSTTHDGMLAGQSGQLF
jgi:hypothetical protein